MKKIRIKSALPIYLAAAVWLLIGLIGPRLLLNTGGLILTALLSAVVYLIGSKLFPGKEIEVLASVDTGNAELNRQIEEGRAQLDRLKSYNDLLPDPAISEKLDRMVRAGSTIFTALEENPQRASEVRRFMNYFLPTAERLVASYVSFHQSPVKGENVLSAMKSVEKSLGMAADAFEKQCDSLYRNESYNIEAEVSVMETLLKGEGLLNEQRFTCDKNEKSHGTKLTM